MKWLTRTGLGLMVAAAVGCGGPWIPPPCPQCGQLNAVYPGEKFPPAAPATEDELGPATADEARAFMDKTEVALKKLKIKAERAAWINRNFIIDDTEEIVAEADEELRLFISGAIKAATRFDGLELDATLARKFALLKRAELVPAPNDPKLTAELAKITSGMTGTYGKGKYCPDKGGALRKALARVKNKKKKLVYTKALKCTEYAKPGTGVTLGALTKLLATSRSEAALREAWTGWRMISPPIRKKYQRYVELGNAGAKEIGFADVGALWRSGYDMTPAQFRGEVERLFSQVKPFYEQLHCYVRMKLRGAYGEDVVPQGEPIPAHLLGNMWSQTWGNVYSLVEPFKGAGNADVTKALARKKYDELKMVRLAERFFTSIGLDPLPKSFWKRSLFKKPRDREVVCHASAWDVHYNNDLRIKMCIQINEEDLQTVHHELGHNYYYQNYYKLPILFQNGAHDGFHEAIGDAIALSITPGYLKKVGLIARVKKDEKATINFLMKMALDKIAFLPFGKLMDQWRWDVFAGKISPDSYNAGWWKLRTHYQGIVPPVTRTEADFDPGAKYHIPANVPYTRYFLAFVLQFQFQRALCKAAGHTGPLHSCSIYENKTAGAKMKALLQLGASKPWQDALEAMSGERTMDANALMAYFKPLRGWLGEQIKEEKCGW